VGPWGEYVDGLRISRGWKYRQMYDPINTAAEKDGEKNFNASRATIRRWIGGVAPTSHKTLEWIATGWNVPVEIITKRTEDQRTWRYEQRVEAAAEPKVAELPAMPAILPPSSAIINPGDPLPYRLTEDTYEMMRRQFLQQLLSVATSVAVGPAFMHAPASATPTDIGLFVQECESNIRACWRLMQGRDMVVVPSVLTSWLPLLDSMLRASSPYRRELAALATEGYMLGGLVTVLQGHLDRAEWFCKQAVDYATVAGHPDLTVAALKHLATKYLDAQYPLLTLQTYERAVQHLDSVSPLLRGRTHLGLALAHAQVGNKADAERHLSLAHDTFPDRPEHDTAFVYADARRASLNHYGGLIHLISGRPNEAWQTFAAALRDPTAAEVPERTIVEIINCQAEAAIALGDVELAASHLETAIHGARVLRSSKRYRDSSNLYTQLRTRWPGDPRARRLEALFVPDDFAPSEQ
jgi:Tfp pilus assembly protein PilF